MRLNRRISALASKVFMLVFFAWPHLGLAGNMTEDQIKSAYVFNFAKFVEWPAGTGTTDKVTLCIIGNDVLGGSLAALDGRKAGNRELHVVKSPEADGHLNDCHLVFIGASEQRRFVAILKSLGDTPPLTISDIDDFSEKGGGIGLLYRENKIVFEVNLASVQKSKLRLPAQLLNLASYVFGR